MLLSGNGANLGCDATFSPSFSPSYSAFIYRGISPIGEAENKPRMAALKSEIARLLLQLDNSCAPTRECDPDTSPVCRASSLAVLFFFLSAFSQAFIVPFFFCSFLNISSLYLFLALFSPLLYFTAVNRSV